MKLLAFLFVILVPMGALAGVLLQTNQGVLNTPAKALADDRWKWLNCGEATDPIQLKSIDVSPDPPKPGQNMTVTVKASVIERIEEGAYAAVVVKVGVIKLLQKKFDLCQEARKANTNVQCPVEEGDYIVEQTVSLPREIPRAKFTVDVRGYTVEDEDLACVDLSIDFRPQFPHLLW